MPAQTFFTPTELFWTLIEGFTHEKTLVECRCGMGTVLEEAKTRNLKVEGIDLVRRAGQSSLVQFQDATTKIWSPDKWPVICRPDHGGWTEDVIRNARKQGATSFYIRLARNYKRDVGMFRTKRLAEKVGVEGESLWVIHPETIKKSKEIKHES